MIVGAKKKLKEQFIEIIIKRSKEFRKPRQEGKDTYNKDYRLLLEETKE